MKHKKFSRFLSALLAVVVLVSALPLSVSAGGISMGSAGQAVTTPKGDYDGIIVEFVSADYLEIYAQGFGGKKLGGNMLWVSGGYKEAQEFGSLSYVESVTYNYIVETDGTYDTAPDDPEYATHLQMQNAQWLTGMQQIEAWATENGITPSTTKVAVLDTGIDGTHPDLVGRVIDGYDTLEDTAILATANSDASKDSHGTKVAGILAATAYNAEGITGTAGAFPVVMMPVRVLDNNGVGTIADTIEGIYWAIDNGADVINMSYGKRMTSFPTALSEAVIDAQSCGILMFAAAGNEGKEVEDYYPACLLPVKAVISYSYTESEGYVLSEFSNYPDPYGNYETYGAYGENIMTTVSGGGYDRFTGTSASTPVLSGFAAVLMSVLGNGDSKNRAGVVDILEACQVSVFKTYQENEDWTSLLFSKATSDALTSALNQKPSPAEVEFTFDTGSQMMGNVDFCTKILTNKDQVEKVAFVWRDPDVPDVCNLLGIVENNAEKNKSDYEITVNVEEVFAAFDNLVNDPFRITTVIGLVGQTTAEDWYTQLPEGLSYTITESRDNLEVYQGSYMPMWILDFEGNPAAEAPVAAYDPKTGNTAPYLSTLSSAIGSYDIPRTIFTEEGYESVFLESIFDGHIIQKEVYPGDGYGLGGSELHRTRLLVSSDTVTFENAEVYVEGKYGLVQLLGIVNEASYLDVYSPYGEYTFWVYNKTDGYLLKKTVNLDESTLAVSFADEITGAVELTLAAACEMMEGTEYTLSISDEPFVYNSYYYEPTNRVRIAGFADGKIKVTPGTYSVNAGVNIPWSENSDAIIELHIGDAVDLSAAKTISFDYSQMTANFITDKESYRYGETGTVTLELKTADGWDVVFFSTWSSDDEIHNIYFDAEGFDRITWDNRSFAFDTTDMAVGAGAVTYPASGLYGDDAGVDITLNPLVVNLDLGKNLFITAQNLEAALGEDFIEWYRRDIRLYRMEDGEYVPVEAYGSENHIDWNYGEYWNGEDLYFPTEDIPVGTELAVVAFLTYIDADEYRQFATSGTLTVTDEENQVHYLSMPAEMKDVTVEVTGLDSYSYMIYYNPSSLPNVKFNRHNHYDRAFQLPKEAYDYCMVVSDYNGSFWIFEGTLAAEDTVIKVDAAALTNSAALLVDVPTMMNTHYVAAFVTLESGNTVVLGSSPYYPSCGEMTVYYPGAMPSFRSEMSYKHRDYFYAEYGYITEASVNLTDSRTTYFIPTVFDAAISKDTFAANEDVSFEMKLLDEYGSVFTKYGVIQEEQDEYSYNVMPFPSSCTLYPTITLLCDGQMIKNKESIPVYNGTYSLGQLEMGSYVATFEMQVLGDIETDGPASVNTLTKTVSFTVGEAMTNSVSVYTDISETLGDVTVNIIGKPGAAVTLYYGLAGGTMSTLTDITVPETGMTTATLTLSAEGINEIYATSDFEGLSATSETITVTRDTTGPEAPAVTANGVNNTTIKVEITLPADAVKAIVYRDGTKIAEISESKTVSDTGLTHDVTYTYTVVPYDKLGNAGQTGTASTSIVYADPNVVAINIGSKYTTGQVDVQILGKPTAMITLYYGLQGGDKTPLSGIVIPNSGEATVTLHLPTDGVWEIYALSEYKEDPVTSDTVSVTCDSQAPAAPTLSVTVGEGDTFNIIVNMAEDAVKTMVYRDGVNIKELTVSDSFVDQIYDIYRIYTYSVISYDRVGNATAQVYKSAQMAVDNEAPEVPELIGAVSGTSVIELSWTRSTDNSLVEGYRIYRDGVLLADVKGYEYSDLGLKRGTKYSYTVTAYDIFGNESAKSQELVFVTEAAAKISNFTIDMEKSPSGYLTSDEVTFTVVTGTLEDGIKYGTVTVSYIDRFHGTEAQTQTITLAGDNGVLTGVLKINGITQVLSATAAVYSEGAEGDYIVDQKDAEDFPIFTMGKLEVVFDTSLYGEYGEEYIEGAEIWVYSQKANYNKFVTATTDKVYTFTNLVPADDYRVFVGINAADGSNFSSYAFKEYDLEVSSGVITVSTVDSLDIPELFIRVVGIDNDGVKVPLKVNIDHDERYSQNILAGETGEDGWITYNGKHNLATGEIGSYLKYSIAYAKDTERIITVDGGETYFLVSSAYMKPMSDNVYEVQFNEIVTETRDVVVKIQTDDGHQASGIELAMTVNGVTYTALTEWTYYDREYGGYAFFKDVVCFPGDRGVIAAGKVTDGTFAYNVNETYVYPTSTYRTTTVNFVADRTNVKVKLNLPDEVLQNCLRTEDGQHLKLLFGYYSQHTTSSICTAYPDLEGNLIFNNVPYNAIDATVASYNSYPKETGLSIADKLEDVQPGNEYTWDCELYRDFYYVVPRGVPYFGVLDKNSGQEELLMRRYQYTGQNYYYSSNYVGGCHIEHFSYEWDYLNTHELYAFAAPNTDVTSSDYKNYWACTEWRLTTDLTQEYIFDKYELNSDKTIAVSIPKDKFGNTVNMASCVLVAEKDGKKEIVNACYLDVYQLWKNSGFQMNVPDWVNQAQVIVVYGDWKQYKMEDLYNEQNQLSARTEITIGNDEKVNVDQLTLAVGIKIKLIVCDETGDPLEGIPRTLRTFSSDEVHKPLSSKTYNKSEITFSLNEYFDDYYNHCYDECSTESEALFLFWGEPDNIAGLQYASYSFFDQNERAYRLVFSFSQGDEIKLELPYRELRRTISIASGSRRITKIKTQIVDETHYLVKFYLQGSNQTDSRLVLPEGATDFMAKAGTNALAPHTVDGSYVYFPKANTPGYFPGNYSVQFLLPITDSEEKVILRLDDMWVDALGNTDYSMSEDHEIDSNAFSAGGSSHISSAQLSDDFKVLTEKTADVGADGYWVSHERDYINVDINDGLNLQFNSGYYLNLESARGFDGLQIYVDDMPVVYDFSYRIYPDPDEPLLGNTFGASSSGSGGRCYRIRDWVSRKYYTGSVTASYEMRQEHIKFVSFEQMNKNLQDRLNNIRAALSIDVEVGNYFDNHAISQDFLEEVFGFTKTEGSIYVPLPGIGTHEIRAVLGGKEEVVYTTVYEDAPMLDSFTVDHYSWRSYENGVLHWEQTNYNRPGYTYEDIIEGENKRLLLDWNGTNTFTFKAKFDKPLEVCDVYAVADVPEYCEYSAFELHYNPESGLWEGTGTLGDYMTVPEGFGVYFDFTCRKYTDAEGNIYPTISVEGYDDFSVDDEIPEGWTVEEVAPPAESGCSLEKAQQNKALYLDFLYNWKESDYDNDAKLVELAAQILDENNILWFPSLRWTDPAGETYVQTVYYGFMDADSVEQEAYDLGTVALRDSDGTSLLSAKMFADEECVGSILTGDVAYIFPRKPKASSSEMESASILGTFGTYMGKFAAANGFSKQATSCAIMANGDMAMGVLGNMVGIMNDSFWGEEWIADLEPEQLQDMISDVQAVKLQGGVLTAAGVVPILGDIINVLDFIDPIRSPGDRLKSTVDYYKWLAECNRWDRILNPPVGNPGMDYYIDPSGYLFEGIETNRIEGVTATVYYLDEATNEWVAWNSWDYDEGPNPQISDTNGGYGWDVLVGKWKVVFEKDGYYSVSSVELDVPPAHLDVNMSMVSYEAPELKSVFAGENGAYIDFTFTKPVRCEDVEALVSVMFSGIAEEGTFTALDAAETVFGNKQAAGEHDVAEGVMVATSFRFTPKYALTVGTTVHLVGEAGIRGYNGVDMEAFTSEGILIPALLPISALKFKELTYAVSKGYTIDLGSELEITGSTGTVVWESMYPEIATVDQNGQVRGVADGRAFIKATCGDVVAITTVEVTTIKHKLTIHYYFEGTEDMARPDYEAWLEAGEGFDVDTIAKPKYTFDKDNISGTMGASDLVYTVYYTAVPVTGVTLNKNETVIKEGASETLVATVAPADAGNAEVTWKSSDESIATVDENGKVTAHEVGTAAITVTTVDGGKTAECVVTVAEGDARGDVNGDGEVDSDDALYLLRHTLDAERYPINQTGDMNGDGAVDSDDAVYLLRHTLDPDTYPLS